MADELVGAGFPAEIKEPFERVPAGTIQFTIEDVAEGMFGKDEKDQTLVIQASLVGEEPLSAAGVAMDSMFFIGIRDGDRVVEQGRAQADPEGQLAATWAARAGRFKQFAEKAGVQVEGAKDRQLTYSELRGRKILGLVEHSVNKTNPDFIDARVKSWWAVGERTPALSEEAPSVAKAAPAAGPRPAARTSPAPAPAPAPATAPAAVRPPVRRLGAR